jgi:hypothetical protein
MDVDTLFEESFASLIADFKKYAALFVFVGSIELIP